MNDVKTLDDYMGRYGGFLASQAEKNLSPLHVPSRDAVRKIPVLREPYEPQWHVIQAVSNHLRRSDSAIISAEMGTGKTLMAMAAVHHHASGRPYRGLVMCPGQLLEKWGRELRMTLPKVKVTLIRSWEDVTEIRRGPCTTTEWFVVGRDKAKLGSGWRPVACKQDTMRDGGFIRCPKCHGRLSRKNGEAVSPSDLKRKQSRCELIVNESGDDRGLTVRGCGEQLWQKIPKPRRFAPAEYIKRKLKGFFDYFVADEIHELKSASSAQGNAFATLAAASKKTIGLTGTLVGGYADHLRAALYRLNPSGMRKDGLEWSDATRFNELYGRIETRIYQQGGGAVIEDGDENKQSRGKKTTTKNLVPGIMPALFGRHMLENAVFLSLDEMADNLPLLDEAEIPVAMDAEQDYEYRRVQDKLTAALKDMVRRGDRRLLGPMVQTLLGYPDQPWGWGSIGYRDGKTGDKEGTYVTVVEPADLDQSTIRPKEQALIDLCLAEAAEGRQCWVYGEMTDKHDVLGRMEQLLTQAGLKAKVMRSSVEPEEREAWIAKHAPGVNVILSHPKLVQTGLDFFDGSGTYNMATIVFYETGYSVFTLRQAARRAWRLGQKFECRVRYLYYQGTMQERAIRLMGEKLRQSMALEGKFSADGLAAIAGGDDGASMELALAKSLVERMSTHNVGRVWRKVNSTPTLPKPPVTPLTVEPVTPPAKAKRGRKPKVTQPVPLQLPTEFVSGAELCKLMRQAKTTIKAVAAQLQVTQVSIKLARKEGTRDERLLALLRNPKHAAIAA